MSDSLASERTSEPMRWRAWLRVSSLAIALPTIVYLLIYSSVEIVTSSVGTALLSVPPFVWSLLLAAAIGLSVGSLEAIDKGTSRVAVLLLLMSVVLVAWFLISGVVRGEWKLGFMPLALFWGFIGSPLFYIGWYRRVRRGRGL